MSRQSNKGFNKELSKSINIHSNNIPVLISPAILRRMGAGQVDLASLDKRKECMTIFEVKSFIHLSFTQRQRLMKSAQFLSEILDVSCRIVVI